MTLHVFAGPTLTEADVLRTAPHARVHPPVRHGDLLRLEPGREDTVLILDGVFHQSAPVRHKEILYALAGGTRVLGASSMGALRAAELWTHGMEGVGLVFGMYARGTLEDDDEVAVSHLPVGDHRQLTLPLVNLRWTIVNGAEAAALVPETADALIALAKTLHYTERSWTALVHRARAHSPELGDAAACLRDFAADHPEECDLKRRDALLAVTHAATSRRPADPGTPAWLAPRTMYLERWRASFRPASQDPRGPAELEVLRFQQLYRPDFPARYRRYALARIAPNANTDDPAALARAALVSATERGFGPDQLTDAMWAYWLTPRELRSGTVRDRLPTVLVRSFRGAPGAAPFYGVPDDLRGTPEGWASSAEAVEAADRLNDRLERTRPGRSARTLRRSVVHRHLADVWEVVPDDAAELTAAARDRGFFSLAEAEDAARRFVLLHLTGAARRGAGPGGDHATDKGEMSLPLPEQPEP